MGSVIRVDLDLTGERDFARGLDQTSRGLDKTGDSAKKAGSELKGMGDHAGAVQKKIAETEVEIKRLVAALDEAGDLDLLKNIRKEQGNLRLLEKLGKSLAVEAQQVGEKAGLSLNKSLTEAVMASKGLLIPPLVAVAVAALPAVGAAASTAIIGGVGTGGIIGGLALAAQDSQVAAFGAQVAANALSSFGRAAEPFIAPAIESLRVLDDAASSVAGDMREAFAAVAPVLVPLTRGLSGLADEAMPGVIKAMNAAKPVFRTIAHELPAIGDAASDFFDSVSEDPEAAVLAFTAMSQAIQGTLRTSGEFIAKLSQLYEAAVRTAAAMSEEWEALFGWLPVAGGVIRDQGAAFRQQVEALDRSKDASGDYEGALRNISRATEDVAKETKTATEAINDFEQAMDKLFGQTKDLQEAQDNYQESIDALAESVSENGKTLDTHTDKGRANRDALRDQITAIKELRDANVANGQSVADANTVYDWHLEQLRANATKLGLNKNLVNELIDAYKGLPERADVEVRASGLAAAIDQVKELRGLLGSTSAAARTRTITVDGVKFKGDVSGYGGGRASGGPVEPHTLYRVNETGVEYLKTGSEGGYVLNAGQTRAMMSGASGGAQWSGQPMVAVVRTGDARLDALLELLDLRIEVALDREAALAGAGPR